MAEGHKVDYYLSKPEYEDVLRGLIPKPKLLSLDHRRHQLGYGHPNYKNYDLSLFDMTGRVKQAEASRLIVPTLGDGEFEHALEDDREFGLDAMEQCGVEVPPYKRFNTPSEAKSFIKQNDKRYVFKPFTIGGQMQDTATTYVAKSAEDLLGVIDKLWEHAKKAPFILQEFITGTEVSVEGLFDGSAMYMLVGNIEDKKFMNDNKGPNTGCASDLVFTLREGSRLYEQGLKRTIPMLQAVGFRGIIDLNSIISGERLYGLEWGPRFGYLCCPITAHMYAIGWGDMLGAVASGKTPLLRWKWEFGAGVTMSIPPYPSEIRLPSAKEIPIEGINPKDIEQLCEYYLYDVQLNGKGLQTSGNYGYIGAAIAGGHTIEQAFEKVQQRIDRVQIPNMQYRTDARKSLGERYEKLSRNSWL
jgi:phosphoribosylamine--glycine ligase